MIPLINVQECTGCGNCVEVCPPGALSLREEKARLREELCEECGFCAPECPVTAIRIPFPCSTDL
jgi:ferredoxin